MAKVAIGAVGTTTGTWTITRTGGRPRTVKTATAETATISIPIVGLGLSGELGNKVKQIKIPYRATTADLSGAITSTLYQTNANKALAAAGVDIDTTTIPTTNDGVVTAAATDRMLTITVTNPAFTSGALVGLVLDVAFPCAASTVLTIYEPYVIFDAADF